MLSVLLNTPRSKEEWDRYTLHHRTSHDLIRQTIRTQLSQNLADYLIDPITLQQPRQWLQANQQLHTDMNTALQVPGSDLEDINVVDDKQLQAWTYLHYQEHRTAEERLGVAS